ncbi:MAG: hypothetical protein ABIF11_01675 [Nitrospirota bacterium]
MPENVIAIKIKSEKDREMFEELSDLFGKPDNIQVLRNLMTFYKNHSPNYRYFGKNKDGEGNQKTRHEIGGGFCRP